MTRVDRETGNCWECQGGLTCMHCHPEDNPKQARRIAELEGLLHEAKYILSNNELEGDATAGRLVSKINHALKA